MPILCLGLSHQSAPLSLLEKTSFSTGQMTEFLRLLTRLPIIEEVVGVSTCNRTEFYLVSPDALAARDTVLDHLVAFHADAPGDEVRAGAYLLEDDQAVAHLFRVAAGVDSLIVGEAQILGQIRRAYEQALELGCAGEVLHTLLFRAITFGRRARVETDISRGNISVASISVRLAREAAGDISQSKLLILGAGETASLVGRHFKSEGVGEIFVLNRSQQNARAMAAELGGRDIPIDRLQSALEMADLVACAVGAPHYIITREGMERIMHARGGQPQVLIDLSMPRNIDPEVARVPGVTLFAIENLESIARENRRAREDEVAKVQHLAEKETVNYISWTHTSGPSKLVTRIRRRMDEVRRERIQRYASTLPDDQVKQLDMMTDSILRAVMHDATTYIRSINPDSQMGALEMEAIHRMFNLDALKAEAEEFPPQISHTAG